MGNKISAVHGVKSDHFYDQGNAINEIWVGDVEIISRLPFGDSDLEQAGWPPGGFPKIPWHHFIIPMHKRGDIINMSAESFALDSFAHANGTYGTCPDWLPTHGYLGMWTGISPGVANFMGIFFLSLAPVVFLAHIYICGLAIVTWKSLRDASALLLDPNDLMRRARHRFWTDISMAFYAFAVCILYLVLGTPALAAGTRGVDAPSLILVVGGVFTAAALIFGFVIQPLLILWFAR